MNKLIRDVFRALHELSDGPLRVSMEHVLRRYDAAANAEPVPLSSVPEGATKGDSSKRCAYCFQTVTEAQANHVLVTESALVGEGRVCTCLGTCKGPEGLGPGWRCALGKVALPETPPQASQDAARPASPESANSALKVSDVTASEAGGDSLVARLREAIGSPWCSPWAAKWLTRAADALEGAKSEAACRIAAAVAEEREDLIDYIFTYAADHIRDSIRARAKKGE